jgi:hypothetical protein
LNTRIKHYKEELADALKAFSPNDEEAKYINLIEKTLTKTQNEEDLQERKDHINNLNKYVAELRQKLNWDDPLHSLLQDIITNVSLMEPVNASIIKNEIHDLASSANLKFMNIYKKEAEGIRNVLRKPRQNIEDLVNLAEQLNMLNKSVTLLPPSKEKEQLAQDFVNNLKTISLRVVNMYSEIGILRDSDNISTIARQINKDSTIGDMLHIVYHIRKELDDDIIRNAHKRGYNHHVEETVLIYKREIGKLYAKLHEGYRMLGENIKEKPLKQVRALLNLRSNDMEDLGRTYIHKVSNSIFITLQQLGTVKTKNVEIIKSELNSLLVELRYMADATNIPLAQIKHALNVVEKLSNLKEMLNRETKEVFQPLMKSIPAYLDQITFSIAETILRSTKVMEKGNVEGESYKRSIDIINKLTGSMRNLGENIDSKKESKRFVNQSLIKMLLLEISILRRNVSSSEKLEVLSALQTIETTLHNLIKYTPQEFMEETRSSRITRTANQLQDLNQNTRITKASNSDSNSKQNAEGGKLDTKGINEEKEYTKTLSEEGFKDKKTDIFKSKETKQITKSL